MKALVIYCHPQQEGSFAAAIRDVVLAHLRAAGAEIRLRDLYAEGFDPVLRAEDLAAYATSPANRAAVDSHCTDLQWCDTLIFIYPTWWYGLPAMLKGWLDRVLLPDVAFLLPDVDHPRLRPALRQIGRMAVFTTCGAGWWVNFLAGFPGRRQLQRGVGWLCKPLHRRAFLALYCIDQTTPDHRARHLLRVGRKMQALIGRA